MARGARRAVVAWQGRVPNRQRDRGGGVGQGREIRGEMFGIFLFFRSFV